MVKIKFTRTFWRGTLAGLDVDDTMTFVDADHCAAWVAGIAANVKRGRLDYRLRDVQVIHQDPKLELVPIEADRVRQVLAPRTR